MSLYHFIHPGGKESLQTDQGQIWNNRGKTNLILRQWFIIQENLLSVSGGRMDKGRGLRRRRSA